MAKKFSIKYIPPCFKVSHQKTAVVILNEAALKPAPGQGAVTMVIEQTKGTDRILKGVVLEKLMLMDIEFKRYSIEGRTFYFFSLERVPFVATIEGSLDEKTLARVINSIEIDN